MANSNGKMPTHRAYSVRRINDEKSRWDQIGAAWPNKDGNGFSIQLFALPIDGKVVLRVIEDKDEQADNDRVPF